MEEPAADAGRDAGSAEMLVHVASLEQLLVHGERTVTRVGDDDVLTLAVNSRIYAVSNVCTHSNGSLWLESAEVLSETRELRCIWHGGCFSLDTGAATRLPCKIPVRTYTVVVRSDEVYVDPGLVEAGPS